MAEYIYKYDLQHLTYSNNVLSIILEKKALILTKTSFNKLKNYKILNKNKSLQLFFLSQSILNCAFISEIPINP